ncbi:MAG: response regulator, partial [Patescibacteria group bacterium]
SGTDALVQVNNNKPDLILLDILLPGMNGFEVLRKIKASSKSRDIPVIVLTNLGSEETDKDRQLALSLGAIDYLVKSYHTPEEMIKIVRSRLSSK